MLKEPLRVEVLFSSHSQFSIYRVKEVEKIENLRVFNT
jgi:hypothetical protein